MSTPPFTLHDTMGALFIGVMVANTLHGISIVQAFYYYSHQPDNDPRALKWLVAAVMLCDTIHQAMITHTVYIYVISNWGNVEVLSRIVPSLIIENVPNSLTALLVQGFLTIRVWQLSDGNILLTTLTVLLVLAEYAAITAFTVLALQFKTFGQLLTLKPLSLTVNILAAAGDVLLAGALCILLRRYRTGFQKSDTMINKLSLFALNTGLLTSLCAVGSFISYMVAPNGFIYVAFYFSIGRLYTNSLLATLNARKMIRHATDNIHDNTADMTPSLRELLKNGPTSNVSGVGLSSSNMDALPKAARFVFSSPPQQLVVHDQGQVHDRDKIESSANAAAGIGEKCDKV